MTTVTPEQRREAQIETMVDWLIDAADLPWEDFGHYYDEVYETIKAHLSERKESHGSTC